MIEYAHIHHVSLAVRDLEIAKKFYSGLLGMQEIERPAFRSTGTWYAISDSGFICFSTRRVTRYVRLGLILQTATLRSGSPVIQGL